MTLVVCWMMDNQINCYADSRLSRTGELIADSSSKQIETVMDSGAKLFIVPVRTTFLKNKRKNEHSYSLGFAFCGSSLIATTTHAIASNCTQQIVNSRDKRPPSVEDIANIYGKTAKYVSCDVNGRLNNPSSYQEIEGVIFGYCPIQQKFRLFRLLPDIVNGNYEILVSELKLTPTVGLVMGSGKEIFKEKLSIPNSAGNERDVLGIFNEIIDDEGIKDVGGYIQVAIAEMGGVKILPVIGQSEEELDKADTTINGMRIADLKLAEGFTIGAQMFGLPSISKIRGRQALRDYGIDPDKDVASREVQNLASIQAAVKHAFEHNQDVILDDNFTLASISPSSSNWYLSASCGHCGFQCPIIIDPSNGKKPLRLKGNGALRSSCIKCYKQFSFSASSLVSEEWKHAAPPNHQTTGTP